MRSNEHLQATIPIATHRDFTHLRDEAASRSILMLVTLDFLSFFFFFSKINTALFSKQSFFQKKTDEDCVKICSLKSYRVTTHTKALWTWTTVDALEIAAIWTNAWGKESKSWPLVKWNSLSWILYFYVSYVFSTPPLSIYMHFVTVGWRRKCSKGTILMNKILSCFIFEKHNAIHFVNIRKMPS